MDGWMKMPRDEVLKYDFIKSLQLFRGVALI